MLIPKSSAHGDNGVDRTAGFDCVSVSRLGDASDVEVMFVSEMNFRFFLVTIKFSY